MEGKKLTGDGREEDGEETEADVGGTHFGMGGDGVMLGL